MTVEVYNSNGSFQVPSGVTSLLVETWGLGATGANGAAGNGGGGGGGGGYAADTLAVNPGNIHNYTFDAATTKFYHQNGVGVLVEAAAGSAGSGTSGGAGGAGNIGSVLFTGGNGGNSAAFQSGGGGGSSASPSGNGSNGGNNGGAGGAGGTDKGAGGNPATSGTPAVAGSSPGGGGGGGAYQINTTGAAGASGQIRITYSAAGGTAVDEPEAFVARTQTVPKPPAYYSYDELRSFAVTLSVDDEQPPFTNKTQSVAWAARPHTDDEYSTALLNFKYGEDDAWIARTQTIAWQARPYSYDEIGVFLLTITSAQLGNYRVQNSIEGWNLWIGSAALPNLTLPPTQFSATLPFSYTLTVPGAGTLKYYVLVTKQDLYGLNSQNQNYTTITIDSLGNLVLPPIPTPTGLLLTPQPGGKIRVMASYPGYGEDAYPATNWRVWIGLTPPNPLIDAPTLSTTVGGRLFSTDIAGYVANTYFVAVALYRSGDSAQSVALTGSVTIPAVPGEVIAVPSGFQEIP